MDGNGAGGAPQKPPGDVSDNGMAAAKACDDAMTIIMLRWRWTAESRSIISNPSKQARIELESTSTSPNKKSNQSKMSSIDKPQPTLSADDEAFPLSDLPSDEIILILLCLNVLDLSQVARTSKRFLYLVHAVQTKIVGTECSALSEKAAALEVNRDERKKQSYRGAKRAGNYRPADVVHRALERMRVPPSVAFMFHTTRGDRAGISWYQQEPTAAESLLPRDCAILSAACPDIQANCGGLVESESGVGVLLASFDRDRSTFVPFHIGASGDDRDDESDDDESGNNSDSSDREDERTKRRKGNDEIQQLIDRLDDAKPATARDDNSFWKIIFVYVSGGTSLDPDAVLARVQEANPNCIIAGGVSSGGHVRLFSSNQDAGGTEENEGEQKRSAESISKATKLLEKRTVRQLRGVITNMIERARSGKGGSDVDEFVLNNIDLTKEDMSKENLIEIAISLGFGQQSSAKNPHDGADLKHIESGIFGVAVGGDGVPVSAVVSRGCRSVISGDVAPRSSIWTVSDAAVLRPGQIGHPFYRGDPAGGNESVHVINRVKNSETGEELDSIDFVLRNRAEFVGIKRTNGDGFDLTMLQSYNVATGHLMLMTKSPDDATGDIPDHQGSQIDLFNLDGQACIEDVGIKLGRLKELVAEKRLLAGLMFSCNGRGPERSYLIKEEMCDANAWNDRFPSVPLLGFYAGGEIGPKAMAGNSNIFQQGHASLQGFTAVFVLFVVPKIELGGFAIDDGPDNVEEFMRRFI